MKRIENRGITLTEIILAALLLGVVLVPLLRSLGQSAKNIENTEKLQMANKIVQSFKEELIAVQFGEFLEYTKKKQPDSDQNYVLDDMFFPNSFNEVLRIQKKYRDFGVSGRFKFIQREKGGDKNMIFVTFEVFWTQPEIGRQSRSIDMTIIEPKN